VIHEKLATLYEAADQGAKAAEHYGAFATAWEAADPHLQPRVERARERLRYLPDRVP
jgi:hypothetical protein